MGHGLHKAHIIRTGLDRQPVCHRARWLITAVSPVIEDGAVIISGGRIVDAGRAVDLLGHFAGEVIDHGDSVLFPAFVNAHTHLELSYLKGRLPEGEGFVNWVKGIVGLLSSDFIERHEQIEQARLAAYELASGMTAVVADIENCSLIPDMIDNSWQWPLAVIRFREIICPGKPDFYADIEKWFDACSDMDVACSLAAHAPYSVGAEALHIIFRQARQRGKPFSIHVAESDEEREFMITGRGPMRDFLSAKLGYDAAKQSPLISSVRFLDRLNILERLTICVHCVHIDSEEIKIMAENGATACLCPGSNRFIGTGAPPVSALFRSGVNVVIGTDSYASNHLLSVQREMALLASMAQDIPPEMIFRAATINGAVALGVARDYGSIESGKKAAVAVQYADMKTGAEIMEFLVSGLGVGTC